MPKSYEKECDTCSERIRITQTETGDWLQYNVDSGIPHFCGGLLKKGYGKLTIKTHCWYCNAIVYFYRDENGGLALFDALGKPWPKHPCWKTNAKHNHVYEKMLYSTLKKYGLSEKAGDYDFIEKNISIVKPRASIRLTSIDHKSVDIAVRKILSALKSYNISVNQAIPLPCRNDGIRMHKRLISFEHSFSTSHSENEQKAVKFLRDLDLPELVQIKVDPD